MTQKPFSKLLIANRGEIAVRIMRACRDMNIQTVAVYSDADRNAPHVRYADEAVHIGPSVAAESYLVIDKILDAAAQTGAEAIHPGYGFLAERADFCEAVQAAGLVFVGPNAHAIRVMGDKLTARASAEAAGVPIVPGTKPGLSDEELIAAGQAIGAPLLVKASAGGGGKGMRPVYDIAELEGAIAAARREAIAAFGDGTVYIEKLITGGRHIEIQVMADAHGNCIHLGERECSLQRRHQKLIEESPSIAVSAETRAAMGQVSCAASIGVDYVGAGTFEFLMDSDKNFYFLEMNTRLQVEHPVTELVTDVDLAKLQLQMAMGEKLPYTQADIKQRGWAIECRINAEDPFSNFMPATGTLTHVTLPTGPGVRVDTGVFAGYEITPYYDSMISKLICYGATREEATARMLRALDEYHLLGVTTNIPFHKQMLQDARFVQGAFDTHFVEAEFEMQSEIDETAAVHAAIAAALLANSTTSTHTAAQSAQPKNGRSNWKWHNRIN